MKRILICGLKDPIGGIENIVKSYTDRFPSQEIICDYVVFGEHFSFEREIEEKGGTVFYLPNRIKFRKAYKQKFKQIFVKNRYDAVWANFSGLTNIDALKLGKKYGVPLRIVHSHLAGFAWTGWAMKYLVPLFHYKNQMIVDRYVTDYWACSESAGKFLFPKRLWKKIVYIHNAVNTAQFYPNLEERENVRKKLGLENCFVVGHMARMCTEKNQLFLLDVFKRLTEIKSNAKLLFVGDGELKKQIFAKAEALGIREKIVFTGFQTDTVNYYRASDVFFLPSLNEGLPLTVIEAQACGVPCVVSPAIPIGANITGCVKHISLDCNVEVWCAALLEMAEHKIENASAIVKEAGYDIDKEAEKLYSFFQRGSFHG